MDSSGLNRGKWHEMLPFIANCVNQTQLCSAKGLSRAQLLFSPYVQYSGMPSEDLFLIQESIYKRILGNRQKILLDRQRQFRPGNEVFKAGKLVFKRNECT